jgi:hypothetical protein
MAGLSDTQIHSLLSIIAIPSANIIVKKEDLCYRKYDICHNINQAAKAAEGIGL